MPTRAKISGNFEPEKMVRLFGSEVAKMITGKEMLTGASHAGDSGDAETNERSSIQRGGQMSDRIRCGTIPLPTELAIKTKVAQVGDIDGASVQYNTMLGSILCS